MGRSSRDEWAKRVERWVDSGLTAAEFGAEAGINPRTLTFWTHHDEQRRGSLQVGQAFVGFYMGSDGFSPTRTFFSKSSATQGLLEIQRQWYMFMLWGRISYNPKISDDVFREQLAQRVSAGRSCSIVFSMEQGLAGLASGWRSGHGRGRNSVLRQEVNRPRGSQHRNQHVRHARAHDQLRRGIVVIEAAQIGRQDQSRA